MTKLMRTPTLAGLCALLLFAFPLSAQQKNTLWDPAFWKATPDVAAVKAEMDKGNSATALNPMAFDATVMAINNDAPMEVITFLLAQEGNGINKLTHDSRNYLHWAANKGNVALVQHLIRQGADLNQEDSHGYTPINFAAAGAQTNTALYDAFFKAGVDPKKKNKDGANLLLLSIAGDKDLVLTDYFVSKGMSLKDVDANGNTAFDYAARSGNVALMKSVAKKGVKHTDNALFMAAQGSRRASASLDTYKYLVDELKIKATATSRNGETVLHSLVRRPGQGDMIAYFLGKGVDVNKADNEGNTAFMLAAGGRETATVDALLPKVKNINATNARGESALTFAVRGESLEILSTLLKNGADVAIKDKDGNTLASHLVQSYRTPRGMPGPGGNGGRAQDSFTAKLKALQAKGLDVAAPQKDGNTLYHVAVIKNDLALMKLITDLNIDVNVKNKEGLTVLHKSAMVSHDDVILKYLLSIGAKKDLKTEFDETAYAMARENEFLTKNEVSVEFLK